MGSSFDRLGDFLSQSFHGGTDMEPVITHALRKISEEGYMETDIITVSDFEMRPVDYMLARSIEHAKAKQTKMYAISLGGRVPRQVTCNYVINIGNIAFKAVKILIKIE